MFNKLMKIIHNLLFNLLLFVCSVFFAISAYNSAHYVWACILSGCAGIMLVLVIALELINRN